MSWIYIKNKDNTARYVLGTSGTKPLFCFGINPSTAEPDNLDNTVKSVARIAKLNEYDSWIMLNLYPQRATNPNDMDIALNYDYLKANVMEIQEIINQYDTADIWAAWGTLIEKRSYLKQCLIQIVSGLKDVNCNWITFGNRSKKGHPHHPLYLRNDSKSEKFNIQSYINGL